MIFGFHFMQPAVVAAALDAVEATPAGHAAGTADVLSTIDRIVSAFAIVLVVVFMGRLAVRQGGDPLKGAPLRPNRFREDSLALAVLVYLLASMSIGAMVQVALGERRSAVATMIIGQSANVAGMVICLHIAARRFDGGIHRFLLADGTTGLGRWVVATVLVTITAIGLCPIVRDASMYVVLRFVPDFEFAPHPTIKALHDPARSIGLTIALWAGAVVLSPVAEELFFRGLLQTYLVRITGNRWKAIVVTSLAFGAVHLQQPHAVLALILLSLLIGYAYERTGSLTPPILIHALFNLKTLVWDALSGSPALTLTGN